MAKNEKTVLQDEQPHLLDYSQIGEFLWLGASPKNGDEFIELIENFDVIIEFNHFPDLQKHNNSVVFSSVEQFQAYQAILQNNQVRIFQAAISDGAFRGAIDVYRNAFDFYLAMRVNARDKRIYVHCKNGKHRSSHFIIFMLMLSGMGYDEAFMWLKTKREVIEQKSAIKQQLLHWFHVQSVMTDSQTWAKGG